MMKKLFTVGGESLVQGLPQLTDAKLIFGEIPASSCFMNVHEHNK